MSKKIILIPTYNEAENILPLIKELRSLLDDGDILVIDDNSPDGTAGLVKREYSDSQQVKILLRSGRRGLGNAYREAYQWALDRGYQKICQLDCDFSHDPALVPKMFAELDNVPMVVGSRYISGGGSANWPWYRILFSRFGGGFGSFVSGLPLRDVTGGFIAFSREALQKIDPQKIKSSGFSIQFELRCKAHAAKVKMKEVPIIFRDRTRGQSKMNFVKESYANLKVAFSYRLFKKI